MEVFDADQTILSHPDAANRKKSVFAVWGGGFCTADRSIFAQRFGGRKDGQAFQG